MIKYGARELLTGRVFVCFLACLLPMAPPWIMRLAPIQLGAVNLLVADRIIYSVSIPMTLLSFLLSALVTDPMGVRLAAFFLTLHRDSENLPSPLSVCDCFGPGYFRLVKGMLLRTVRVMLWTLLPLAICALVPGAWETAQVSGMDVIRVADWTYVFLLAALVLNVNRGLCYSMVPYLLADRPELGPVDALRESRRMTHRRLWELFVVQLSFLGWMLLTSITFFIGAIYTYPYIEATMAGYYLAFAQPMPWERPLATGGDLIDGAGGAPDDDDAAG